MKKELLFLELFLFLVILFTSNVSANFACGLVNPAQDNSENFSTSWMDVLIYYSEKPNNFIFCKINPESKFCCDLEEISSVKWSKGKMVFAEVFDKDSGYIGGPVNLTTSEEGYDLFPEINVIKAVKINSPVKRILINESKVFFNLSLAENYNNLRYFLNSSDNSSEGIICENCQNPQFSLDLNKGKNTIKLTAYGNREIFEVFEVYSLDYFSIINSFECEKCTQRGSNWFIPSDKEVNLTVYFNSSHPVSGDLFTYFPLDWEIKRGFLIENYSWTHNLIKSNISGLSGQINYSFKTPKTFLNRKDFFKYGFGDYSLETKITVLKLPRFLPFYYTKRFSNHFYSEHSLKNKISPAEPLILNPGFPNLDLIAVYPKYSIKGAFVLINYNKKFSFKAKVYEFNIITNIPNEKIDNILFRFKCHKDKSLEFYNSNSEIIKLNKYKEDKSYDYFEVYLDKIDTFTLKIF